MSHWPCRVFNCDHGALMGRYGYCKNCLQRFCFTHIEDGEKHLCASKQADVFKERKEFGDWFWHKRRRDLLAKIRVTDLIDEAQRLRPGRTCQGPPEVVQGAEGVIIHGGNVHIVLTFNDGIKWLARIKHSLDVSPPLHVQKQEKLSEAATIQVLHQAGVLVSRVWLRPDSEHPSDLNYFFVEFVEGRPHPDLKIYDPITRSPTDRELIIIESYAKNQLSLEQVTFDKIGSPTFNPEGKVVVGPMTYDLAPLAESPYYLGPFFNQRDRYIAYFDTVLAAIAENRWCAPSKSLAFYQGILEAKRLVEGCAEMKEEPGIFYIKHGEPKCDHFLVNGAGEITSMLDWECTSKADAFAAPLGFIPAKFLGGNNSLSLLELALAAAYRKLDRGDLAICVERGKRYQRLDDLLFGAFPSFIKLKALRQCFEDSQQDWPTKQSHWSKYALNAFRGDERMSKLIAEAQARKAAKIGARRAE